MVHAHALPDDYSGRGGKLLKISGPVIDVAFPADQQPPMLSLLSITGISGATLNATVAQHLDDGTVRGIVTAPEWLAPGMQVQPTGAWVEQPLDEATLRQAVELMSNPAQVRRPKIVETGLKVVDLLAPYPSGGRVAIIGPMGVGKTVLIQEVIHNLRTRDEKLLLFIFVKPGAEIDLFRDIEQEAADLSLSLAQMIMLATTNPRDIGPLADRFDAITCMSLYRVANSLWPAVDPVRSSSRLLTPQVAGAEHVAAATGVRDLLRRFKELEQCIHSEAIDSSHRTTNSCSCVGGDWSASLRSSSRSPAVYRSSWNVCLTCRHDARLRGDPGG